MSWYLEALRKYAVFEGRARRMEYWMFVLMYVVIGVALGVAAGIFGIGHGMAVNLVALAYSVGMLIPSLSVGVRRLHDTGRSGWWLLVALIPLIGAVILIVFALQDSEPGSNRYGPNPKGAMA